MPTKRRRGAAAPPDRDATLCGVSRVNIYSGRNGSNSLTQLQDSQKFPEDTKVAMRLARRWQEENWFVGPLITLRTSFYNFGFRLTPAGVKPSAAERKALEEWLQGNGSKAGQRGPVTKLVRQSLEELQLVDNSVALWRDYSAPEWLRENNVSKVVMPAYLAKPEICTFSDKFGLEVLKMVPDVTQEELKERGFSERVIRRYTNGEIKLDPVRWGEHFKVLRRDGFDGFAFPRLNSVFKVLSQNESMEVGEQALAMLGRTVWRLWKMGFEPKVQAVAQGTMKHWKYDSKQAIAWEKSIKAVIGGLAQSVQQFDRKAEDVWVDPKYYNGEKWDTILNRLMWWGGPLAYMMVAKSVSPFLLGMLKTLAAADRELIRPHVEDVIQRSFKPPFPVTVSWSDECFSDARLAWDMLKVLMQQGPASLTTAMRKAGLDPLEEDEHKRNEKDRKDDLMPLLLPGRQNVGAGSSAGRQAGQADGTAV